MLTVKFNYSDEMYEGALNAIVLIKKMTVEFSCQFQLSYYPFDTQSCQLLFFINAAERNLRIIKVREWSKEII